MYEICSKVRINTPERRYWYSFCCLYSWLWADFRHRSSISIVDFEQVNADWELFGEFHDKIKLSNNFTLCLEKWILDEAKIRTNQQLVKFFFRPTFYPASFLSQHFVSVCLFLVLRVNKRHIFDTISFKTSV